MYEGFLGALIMRQGYYIANGKKLPAWLKLRAGQVDRAAAVHAAEYDFWYNGKAATSDLPGITGRVGDIKKGQFARRRLVPQALLQVHRLELVLHGERVPGEEVQRVPQQPDA